jgi:triphosphoribosyl-dephospho-CoA synthetase
MEVWQIVLYAIAALLALKSLTTLMTAHRARLLAEIERREEEALQQELERVLAEKAAVKKAARRAGAA